MRKLTWSVLGLSFGVLSACGDDPPDQKTPTLGDTGKVPAFAVVSSDYTATSISILEDDGDVIADDYINSGSERAGLSTAISGDAVLPTVSGENGVLVIIDRFRTGVITRVNLEDGEVLSQTTAQKAPNDGSDQAYSSNPQDYSFVDEGKAWITRYEPNLDPRADARDKGTDLVSIDPSDGKLSGDRIDLSKFDTKGTRTNFETGAEEEVTVYARPSSLVRLGSWAVVGLSRLSFDFSAAGPGAVALVDLDKGKAQEVKLEGLSNCGSVSPVEGSADSVLVGCSGFFGAERETGGLVILRIEDGKAKQTARWNAKDHADAPIAVNNPVSLGGKRVAATSFGAIDYNSGAVTSADGLSLIDLDSGDEQTIFESKGAYTLGQGAFEPKARLLLVPDASTDADKRPTQGVLRFEIDADELDAKALKTVKVGGHGTPARQVRPL